MQTADAQCTAMAQRVIELQQETNAHFVWNPNSSHAKHLTRRIDKQSNAHDPNCPLLPLLVHRRVSKNSRLPPGRSATLLRGRPQ